MKTSSSIVTAAVRASARPRTVTELFTVTEARARIVPTKVDPTPSVAELPTCQNTLHSWAPPMSVIVLPVAVVRLEFVWKMKTDVGSPAPSSTKGPVSWSAPLLGPA